jgi:hypothetical protein
MTGGAGAGGGVTVVDPEEDDGVVIGEEVTGVWLGEVAGTNRVLMSVTALC